MHSVSAPELDEMIKEEDPILVDVRTPEEFAICAIKGAINIPLDEFVERHEELEDQNGTYVCICHHGFRSAKAALFLLERGYTDVINLEGGVNAWAHTVDPTMPRY